MKKKILSLAVVLALLSVLVTPTAALAAIDTTDVSGELLAQPITYSLETPETLDVGSFNTIGDYPSAVGTITATTSGGGTVDIEVADVSANDGHLTLAAESFFNPLQAKGGPIVSAYADVSGVALLLADDVDVSSPFVIPDFYVQQSIVASDLALTPGIYTTTLTFTATFSTGP